MNDITINQKDLDKKDQLKLRMLKAKTGLPTAGYAALFKFYYPKSNYKPSLLSQVWTCKLMNKDIIEKFENISEQLKIS